MVCWSEEKKHYVVYCLDVEASGELWQSSEACEAIRSVLMRGDGTNFRVVARVLR